MATAAFSQSNIVASARTTTTTYPALVVFAALALWLAYNKLQAGLRGIPGPTVAAYTKLWRLYDVYRGNAHWTAIALHQQYGCVVRIGPNHVSLSDPSLIPLIYGTKENFAKTGFYPIQSISWKKQPQMNLFSTRDPEYHRVEKRKVGAAYSMPNLLQSEEAIDSCVKLFMQRLGELASRGDPVDLGEWLHYYAFDVVGEVTFARKLGFLEEGKDIDVGSRASQPFLVIH
jgi:hypothetical protein